MSSSPFPPRYAPCAECGDSIDRTAEVGHVCERERWLDYQLFRRREEIQRFDGELGAYLRTPRGRFELWYAERTRRV